MIAKDRVAKSDAILRDHENADVGPTSQRPEAGQARGSRAGWVRRSGARAGRLRRRRGRRLVDVDDVVVAVLLRVEQRGLGQRRPTPRSPASRSPATTTGRSASTIWRSSVSRISVVAVSGRRSSAIDPTPASAGSSRRRRGRLGNLGRCQRGLHQRQLEIPASGVGTTCRHGGRGCRLPDRVQLGAQSSGRWRAAPRPPPAGQPCVPLGRCGEVEGAAGAKPGFLRCRPDMARTLRRTGVRAWEARPRVTRVTLVT